MNYRRIVSLIMLVVMAACSFTTTCFADSINEDGIEITPVNDNALIISDGEDSVLMECESNESEDIYSVTDLEGEEEDYYFSYDKDSNTLYSSLTGEYIDLSEDEELTPSSQIEPIYEIQSERVGAKYVIISYKKLAQSVLPSSSQINIASAILVIAAAVLGVTLSPAASAIIPLIPWDTIRTGISNKASNHGVRLLVGIYTQRRHEGGKIVYGHKYKVEKVTAY